MLVSNQLNNNVYCSSINYTYNILKLKWILHIIRFFAVENENNDNVIFYLFFFIVTKVGVRFTRARFTIYYQMCKKEQEKCPLI